MRSHSNRDQVERARSKRASFRPGTSRFRLRTQLRRMVSGPSPAFEARYRQPSLSTHYGRAKAPYGLRQLPHPGLWRPDGPGSPVVFGSRLACSPECAICHSGRSGGQIVRRMRTAWSSRGVDLAPRHPGTIGSGPLEEIATADVGNEFCQAPTYRRQVTAVSDTDFKGNTQRSQPSKNHARMRRTRRKGR
jgi:hypothetical protein